MHAVNLAIVFGMGLAPNTNAMGISPDLGLYQTMVKTWIISADQIFPELSEEDDQSSSTAGTSMIRAESAPSQPSEPSTPALDHGPLSPALSLEENGS